MGKLKIVKVVAICDHLVDFPSFKSEHEIFREARRIPLMLTVNLI